MIGTPWNQIEIDPCFRRIDCSNFNVQLNNNYKAIAKYVKSKLQVSMMAAFWYLSDTDQCCIFRQDIWKTIKCPQVYLCDAFLPEFEIEVVDVITLECLCIR